MADNLLRYDSHEKKVWVRIKRSSRQKDRRIFLNEAIQEYIYTEIIVKGTPPDQVFKNLKDWRSKVSDKLKIRLREGDLNLKQIANYIKVHVKRLPPDPPEQTQHMSQDLSAQHLAGVHEASAPQEPADQISTPRATYQTYGSRATYLASSSQEPADQTSAPQATSQTSRSQANQASAPQVAPYRVTSTSQAAYQKYGPYAHEASAPQVSPYQVTALPATYTAYGSRATSQPSPYHASAPRTASPRRQELSPPPEPSRSRAPGKRAPSGSPNDNSGSSRDSPSERAHHGWPPAKRSELGKAGDRMREGGRRRHDERE